MVGVIKHCKLPFYSDLVSPPMETWTVESCPFQPLRNGSLARSKRAYQGTLKIVTVWTGKSRRLACSCVFPSAPQKLSVGYNDGGKVFLCDQCDRCLTVVLHFFGTPNRAGQSMHGIQAREICFKLNRNVINGSRWYGTYGDSVTYFQIVDIPPSLVHASLFRRTVPFFRISVSVSTILRHVFCPTLSSIVYQM